MKTGQLRITIICGCLAPGQDGVGDYSRILAAHAAALGHAVQLISIADTTTSHSESGSFAIHRFKNVLQDTTTYAEVSRLIHTHSPEWLSLQFVNFSYHPKGLIHHLIAGISGWRMDRKLHVMFHEYWMERQQPFALKRNLHAYLQARLVKQAVRKWSPDHMDTSNQYYATELARAGIHASILPLFSNIPITSDLTADSTFIQTQSNRAIFLFPFAQHQDWNPAPVMQRLQALAIAKGIPPHVIQVGKNPHHKRHWPVIRAHADKFGWQCDALGVQDDATISALLQHATLGITTKHFLIAGKSGAVQAMREHDLPIFFGEPSPTAVELTDKLEQGLLPWELSDNELAIRLQLNRTKTPQPMAEQVCKKWVHTLANLSEA